MHKEKSVKYSLKNKDNKKVLKGYIAVFDMKDSDGDIFTQKTELINYLDKPPLLFMHKTDTPIGVVNSISKDDKGFVVEAELIETDLNREYIQSIEKGLFNYLSVGVGMEYNDSGEVDKALIYEVSVVSIPAQRKAEILKNNKNMEKQLNELKETLAELSKTLKSMNDIVAKEIEGALKNSLSKDNVDDKKDNVTSDPKIEDSIAKLNSIFEKLKK